MAGLSGRFPVYATADDLRSYVGSEESPATIANADDLLNQASRDVRRATRAAVYAVDADSMPTPGPIADALHDATVLQAAALHSIGWARATEATKARPNVVSKSMGGVSVTYERSSGQQRADALAGGDLDADALQVLEDAGLLVTGVISGGSRYVRPLHRVRGIS